jgi:hypothetical protein
MMVNFKRMLESVAGKRILSVRRESSSMERMSRLATRQPIEFEPPGPKIEILTTNDINPDTGRLYPDYKERRALRRAKESETLGDLNVFPDDL